MSSSRRPKPVESTATDGLVTTHVKYYSSQMSPSNSNIELASVAQPNGRGPTQMSETAGFGFRE